MTLGLRHVAAAAFVVAATSVFQHADAQPCDDVGALAVACVEDATCNGCAATGADPAVSECTQTIDFLGLDECGVLNAVACCYNEVGGVDCLANDLWWELTQCNTDGITCDNRTCEGTGGETSPTPSTTTTAAPAAGGGAETDFSSTSITEECTPLLNACAEDETCAACAILDGENLDPFIECVEMIDEADVCAVQTANFCCYSQVTGLDCLSNDAFWEYLRCPGFGADQTCDTRSCGATGGGGGAAPTPATTATPAPGAGSRGETVAPAAAADATVSPAAASSAASSTTAAPADASFMTAAPSSAASSPGATPEPTPSSEGGGGVGDGGATPEPTSPAERGIDVTSGPTTAEEAEESDASGTANGAGLGASWSPVGMAVAGLVAVLALLVGV